LKTRPKQLLGSLPLDIALPNKCLIFRPISAKILPLGLL
jgi:hypothetical protein